MNCGLVLVFCVLALDHRVSANGFGPGNQDFGYVTVRPGAHMFWWLYHTTANVTNSSDRPLIIWLQGGPGASSAGYGNFKILGPLNEELKPRNHTWVKDFNVLFIDNPVGTGYSYVDNPKLLTKNNSEIARDLFSLLESFYQTLPQFIKTPLYVYGQSYGGKMAVEFAQLLVEEVNKGNIRSNITGVAMGDSWIDPIESVLSWAPYLYQFGYIDNRQREIIMKQALKTKRKFDCGNFVGAKDEYRKIQAIILNFTHGVDFYNVINKIKIRESNLSPSDNNIINLMNDEVKKSLKIIPEQIRWKLNSNNVFNALSSDFMKPVTNIVEDILNNTSLKVHVYNGNLDLIVDTPGQLEWVNRMQWKDRELYLDDERKAIIINNTIEGYEKTGGKFSFFWINAAGHSAPSDNPTAIRYMLRSMTGF